MELKLIHELRRVSNDIGSEMQTKTKNTYTT